MAKKGHSTSDHLEPHSEAKIELICTYLAIYLNILERAEGTSEVHILDVLCGEGKYRDGKLGSAVQVVRTVADHHYATNTSSNRIRIVLNDIGKSDVERGLLKIDRVRRVCQPIERRLPVHITVEYFNEDAVSLCQKELSQSSNRRSLKRLFIIDPTGISQFDFRYITPILDSYGTEVILFMPVSHMFRFRHDTNSAFASLVRLLWKNDPMPSDRATFRSQLVERVDRLVGPSVYTTPISLERSKSHVHILFHFTKSLRGLEKMVDAIWNVDPDEGRGFGPRRGKGLFTPEQLFRKDLMRFIKSEPKGRTNREIAIFTLTKLFRTTVASNILQNAFKEEKVDRQTLDQEPARGFYLRGKSLDQRLVRISVKQGGDTP